MSSSTRNQESKYQYKNVAIANTFFCGPGPTMRLSVPDNLLDIKAVFMHVVFKFDSDVPQSRRVIKFVGGSYPIAYTNNPNPANGNMIQVDVQADPSTRIADCKIDITRLKQGLLDSIANDGTDQPSMQLSVVTDDGSNDVRGDIILWKVDLAYTTTGIQ